MYLYTLGCSGNCLQCFVFREIKIKPKPKQLKVYGSMLILKRTEEDFQFEPDCLQWADFHFRGKLEGLAMMKEQEGSSSYGFWK